MPRLYWVNDRSSASAAKGTRHSKKVSSRRVSTKGGQSIFAAVILVLLSWTLLTIVGASGGFVLSLALAGAFSCVIALQGHLWVCLEDRRRPMWPIACIPLGIIVLAPALLAIPQAAAAVPSQTGMSITFLAFWITVLLATSRAASRALGATSNERGNLLYTVVGAFSIGALAALFGITDQVSAPTQSVSQVICTLPSGAQVFPKAKQTVTVGFDGRESRVYEVSAGRLTFEAPAYYHQVSLTVVIEGLESEPLKDVTLFMSPSYRYFRILGRVLTLGQMAKTENTGIVDWSISC